MTLVELVLRLPTPTPMPGFRCLLRNSSLSVHFLIATFMVYGKTAWKFRDSKPQATEIRQVTKEEGDNNM